MSKKHHAHQRRTVQPRGRRRWGLVGLGVMVVGLAAAGLFLARSITAGSAVMAPPNTEAHVKGAATAPVTIVEWGDFQ